ncbi:hypothetical protein ALO83_103620 [Pseudomonas cannabina pv. alisalensis]|uniref:Uncharacterized protein n=1 Tax=Pseudomonas cannabina TaxID=86840 RepID=A0A3M3PSH0_PSECA|nr:Uncharacterized protein AC507_0737 [Pseudomonas syringae pv. maculicola]KPW15784.1 hypothetical protein ALO83_103620 [Pseudomonas cannabina pv. alisalensis]RMN74930.1 hypothetical protein ALQ53_103385 [Pseudomonas cannabina]RMN79163.1 hypothetical protein ALQ52_104269 [Pseudomonas cannabina pv. alisalensis]RMO00258.1 hypothetical protein ALQ51_102089 [Pseudomonas cannabina]
MVEQTGRRRWFAPDHGTGQAALLKLGTPGQYVGTVHCVEFLGAGEAHESAEVFQVILVRPPCARVVYIGKSFGRCRHRSQVLECLLQPI